MIQYRLEITKRPVSLGGGWNLHCFEDQVEVMGGVFSCSRGDSEEAISEAEAYSEAATQASEWIESRFPQEDGQHARRA